MSAETMKKTKKPFSMKKWVKEQERTTDHRHTVLHDHSPAFAVRVHLSSFWRDGKIQFL